MPPARIPIRSIADSEPRGCSDCASTPALTSCAAAVAVATRLGDAEIRGPAAEVERVLGELRRVVDLRIGRDIVELQLVRALRLDDGEAELQLAVSPGCAGGRRVAQDAFAVLRQALPDTDIYVRHVVA